MKFPVIIEALNNLGFETGFILYGEDIEGLIWLDEVENKPTNEEVLAEVEKINA
jgi:hypothetical protein